METETVIEKLDPKKQAIRLGDLYRLLKQAASEVKAAVRNLEDVFQIGSDVDDVSSAQSEYLRVIRNAEQLRCEVWFELVTIPTGITASGGATAQTVAMEFFNRSLSRDMKNRLSPSDARRLNKASWGGR